MPTYAPFGWTNVNVIQKPCLLTDVCVTLIMNLVFPLACFTMAPWHALFLQHYALFPKTNFGLHFAWDPMCSWFHKQTKNLIYFLNTHLSCSSNKTLFNFCIYLCNFLYILLHAYSVYIIMSCHFVSTCTCIVKVKITEKACLFLHEMQLKVKDGECLTVFCSH